MANKVLQTTFSIPLITDEETMSVLNKINTRKSSSVDNISTAVLKDSFETLPSHLTSIFIKSIATHKFPHSRKVATVIP